MEDSNANQATSPSPTARRSGGPRTAEGKRRSCRNARKHGLYTDERFLEAAALELGDDPRQFQRLRKSLVQARRPVGGLETALVEDIALLFCKKARVDRSELAVQVSNLHRHDLERRKLCLQVGTCNSDAVEFEVREKGLRRFLDSPGKFEQVLGFLTSLIAMIDKNEFGYGMKEALIALYGSDFTLRGVKLYEYRYALEKMPPGEDCEQFKRAMMKWVLEEISDVGRGIRTVPARARADHAGSAHGSNSALAGPVGGHHPPAELARPATGTQDTLADGVAAGTEERSTTSGEPGSVIAPGSGRPAGRRIAGAKLPPYNRHPAGFTPLNDGDGADLVL
jgi:hypothetical protein